MFAIYLCTCFFERTHQDIELSELLALKGAMHTLVACRPVLFVEMLCAAGNKLILELLDDLGYISSWVAVPFLYPTEEVENDFPLQNLFSGVNMISVPREHEYAVNSHNALRRIEVSKGWFSLSNYNITVCATFTEDCILWDVADTPSCSDFSDDIKDFSFYST